MEYIINPSWFYWVSVFDWLKAVCLILGIVIIAGIIICIVGIDYCYDDDEKKIWVKRLKLSIMVSLLCIFAAVFIPSESTMIKMMLAKYATADNVQTAYQAILDGARYILEGLK